MHAPGGWIVGLCYFAGGIACLLAGNALCGPRVRRERWIWGAIAVLFAMLGAGRQLDLHTAFTQAGRIVSLDLGLYRQREYVQIFLIAGAGAVATALAAGLIYLVRGMALPTRVAAAFAALLAGFAFVQAVSLHRIDRLIGTDVFGIRWNWLVETVGIAAVILASLRRRQSAPR